MTVEGLSGRAILLSDFSFHGILETVVLPELQGLALQILLKKFISPCPWSIVPVLSPCHGFVIGT